MFIFVLFIEIIDLLLWFGIGIFINVIAVLDVLPDLTEIEQVIRRPYIRIMDRDHNLLAAYGDFYDQPVEINALPAYLIYALIDTEDRRFYDHIGFDMIGILRAFRSNLQAGKVTQGGSSITQQLAKNFFIANGIFHTNDQSLRRKAYEVIVACVLEKRYSKHEILKFYINRVYFGGGAFGISAAAERFFNKKPKDLNVYEAARLIGMIQAPSRYVAKQNLAEKRAEVVLENMQKNNHISQAQKEFAIHQKTQVKHDGQNKKMVNYFTDWILKCLDEKIFANVKDVTIYTTLDPKWQELAQHATAKTMMELGQAWEAETVALLATDKTGAIRSMIGGVNYQQNNFNNVTSAYRQPGSLFKVLIYLAALEKDYTPDSIMNDAPINYGGWEPLNFNKKFGGKMSLMTAFAHSVNTISVQLAVDIGVKKIQKLCSRLGIASPIVSNYTIALGTSEVTMLEMVTPFLTLLNQGRLMEPYAIERIIETKTNRVLYQHENQTLNIVLGSQVVNNMLDLLEACTKYGSGRRANFGHDVMGKTGTTQNHRDQWFGGMTAHAVTLVRFSTNKKGMNYQPGQPIHVICWKEFMQTLHAQMKFKKEYIYGSEGNTVINKKEYNQLVKEILVETDDPFAKKVVYQSYITENKKNKN